MTLLGLEPGTLVAVLALLGLGLFIVASLAGRWPLWLAGFLVAALALLAAFLRPHDPAPADTAAPTDPPARVTDPVRQGLPPNSGSP